MNAYLGSASVLALVAGGLPAFAQQAPATAETAAEPADEGMITVTARLRDEKLVDVPIPVSVVTTEQLNRDQIFTLTDLQRITPALQVSPSFGGDVNGGAGIRGIRTQAFNPSVSPSVAIVVDQAAAGNVTFPILHDLARVEVLRGPQGTLFGQGASAGVINVATVAPELGEHAANFNIDYADDGTAGSESTEIVVRGGVSVPLGSRAALRVSALYRDQVGLRTNSFLNNLDDRSTELALRTRLYLEPASSVKVHLIADYARIEEDGVNFFSPSLAPSSTRPFGPPGSTLGQLSLNNLIACGVTRDRITPRARFYCEDAQSQEFRDVISLTGIMEFALSDVLTLTSVTSYREHDVISPRRNFSVRAIGFAARDENLRDDYRQFSQELRLAYTGTGFDVVAGGFFNDFDFLQSPINSNLPFGDPRPGFRTGLGVCQPTGLPCNVPYRYVREQVANQTIAAFADVTIALSDRAELFGGLRYTNFRNDSSFGVNTLTPTDFGDIRENNLSGRIGISYEAGANTNLYASYSRGYKPSALAFPANVGQAFIELRAEENSAFEIGAKTQLGGIQLDANIFYMNVANFQGQESVNVAGELISQSRNIGTVKSWGVELMANGRISDRLSVNAGYQFNPVTYPDGFIGDDGINLGGQQVLSAPRHKLVLSGEYVQPITSRVEAFLDANIVVKSAIRLSNRDTARFVFPAGETVNLRAGIRDADGKWTASLFVRNLTRNREPSAYLPMNFAGLDDGSARARPIAGITTRVVGASLGFNF